MRSASAGPVPLGLDPLLRHQLELGLHPATRDLEPLALVLGPLGLALDVTGLGHRRRAALLRLFDEP